MSSRPPGGFSRAFPSALGWVLLLVAVGALTLWRARLETSLWIDETYSLLLTTYPADQIVARTALDAHPPGYYLVLKAWLKAARATGFEPGVLWARLLNGALWLVLAATAWFGGRRLVGRQVGMLLTVVVAGGSCAALVARELRSYGMATVFLFGAYLALVAAVTLPTDGPRGRRLLWRLWGLYALSATLALWMHLLSAVVLAALGVVWLGFHVGRRGLVASTVVPAAVGQAVPVLLFSPWLVRIGQQMSYLEHSDPQWMTPPTVANLGWVFAFWYPFGRIGDPAWEGNRLVVVLGVLAVLVPVSLAVVLASRRRETALGSTAADRERTAATAGVFGLGAATIYVLTIWLLDRLDLAHTFHGPRYPVLAVALWSAGLVCLVAGAGARHGVRQRWLILAFLPWLLASATGQILLAQRESRGELSGLETAAGADWPAPGEALYLMPSELAPFYRNSLQAFDLRRIERLPCEAAAGGSAVVLDVNFWKELDRPRDHLIRSVLERRRLGTKTRKLAYPPHQPSLVLYRVESLDGVLLEELCRRGLDPPLRDRMAGSASAAMPEDQLSPDHWSYVEVSPALELYRWSKASRTAVVFNRSLPPGDYTLHVVGYRPSEPEPVIPIGFTLEGGGVARWEEMPPGRFHLRFEVTWPRRARAPVLFVEHPVWSSEGGGEGAPRTLSFLLYGAWFTPVSGEPVSNIRSYAGGSGRLEPC